MLILSRRESECIHLGDDIVLTIVRVSGEKVRIGVEAPPHVKILRNELELSKSIQTSSESEPSEVTDSTKIAAQMDMIPLPEKSGQDLPGQATSEAPQLQTPPPAVRKVPIQVKRAA
jgi:carbon storage regulator